MIAVYRILCRQNCKVKRNQPENIEPHAIHMYTQIEKSTKAQNGKLHKYPSGKCSMIQTTPPSPAN